MANENNIYRKTFDHRTNDEYNQYTYDDLDRLIDVDYLVNGTPDHEETFVMDTLGNRTGDQTLTQGTVDFTVDSATNRYSSVGGNTITHDFAGNMTTDKGGYKYYYDYENRLVKIEDSSYVEMATFDGACPERSRRDALGRRIRVIDKSADPDVTTLYYHNPNWQVLAEYDGSNNLQRYFVYGNYIDEALVMNDATDDFYYVQDHLYSTVALVNASGTIVERYEYGAYGQCSVFGAGTDSLWFTADDTNLTESAYGNPYGFTSRRMDMFDSDNLTNMHYRIRDYNVYTGRFLQEDPMGGCGKGGGSPTVDDEPSCYCFCVDNAWIDLKQIPKGNSDPGYEGFFGAEISAEVRGHWVKWPNGERKPGKPLVEWYEWFTQKPTHHKKWYEGKKFKTWERIQYGYPIAYPTTDYLYPDLPGASPGIGGGGIYEKIYNQRNGFVLRVEGKPDCPCEKQPNNGGIGKWLIYRARKLGAGTQYNLLHIDSGDLIPWQEPPDFPSTVPEP